MNFIPNLADFLHTFDLVILFGGSALIFISLFKLAQMRGEDDT